MYRERQIQTGSLLYCTTFIHFLKCPSYSSDLEQGYMVIDFSQCRLFPGCIAIVLIWGGQSVSGMEFGLPGNPFVSTSVCAFSAGPLKKLDGSSAERLWGILRRCVK